MTKRELLEKIVDYQTGDIFMKEMEDAVDDYSTALIAAKLNVRRSVPPTVAEVVPEAEKLLEAVKKHHPHMNMETQLDLYMAYHDLKNALGRHISA